MLACSTDLALAVLAGAKALDAAYGEAKKAKQQLDGKGVVKTRRAANMRRRKRSAGDHNHGGADAENPEPGVTPEVIRDRAYTWQAGEALRLAHENKLAPIDPKEVIRAAIAEAFVPNLLAKVSKGDTLACDSDRRQPARVARLEL